MPYSLKECGLVLFQIITIFVASLTMIRPSLQCWAWWTPLGSFSLWLFKYWVTLRRK